MRRAACGGGTGALRAPLALRAALRGFALRAAN